jgi:hypothetical protein
MGSGGPHVRSRAAWFDPGPDLFGHGIGTPEIPEGRGEEEATAPFGALNYY